MTPTAALAAVRSLIESDPDAVGLIDRCDLMDMTFVDGGAAGDSVSLSTTTSNQPCMHEEISGPAAVLTIGGETVVATHRIFIPWSAGALALTEKGKIKVFARDPYPQMIFEKPVRSHGTLEPLAEFKARLVQQGYQQ